MKIVQVTYTTTHEFYDQNKKNIHEVMEALKNSGADGIRYHVCIAPNGKTFMHTAFFKSEEDQQFLNALASFKEFQSQLKTNGFEIAPKQELFTFVESSFPIFK